MPVFESAAMIPPQTRREALTEVRAQLDTVSGSILNIRVGGNDLSHAFGLRRPANRTIYDLRPVADILIDIVAAFGTQYVVSGPVWEYYSGEGWEEGAAPGDGAGSAEWLHRQDRHPSQSDPRGERNAPRLPSRITRTPGLS